MDKSSTDRRVLDDYPLSLQSAARALWGDDFWGRDAPRPAEKRPRSPIHRR